MPHYFKTSLFHVTHFLLISPNICDSTLPQLFTWSENFFHSFAPLIAQCEQLAANLHQNRLVEKTIFFVYTSNCEYTVGKLSEKYTTTVHDITITNHYPLPELTPMQQQKVGLSFRFRDFSLHGQLTPISSMLNYAEIMRWNIFATKRLFGPCIFSFLKSVKPSG